MPPFFFGGERAGLSLNLHGHPVLSGANWHRARGQIC
jgi:hypothetical protein